MGTQWPTPTVVDPPPVSVSEHARFKRFMNMILEQVSAHEPAPGAEALSARLSPIYTYTPPRALLPTWYTADLPTPTRIRSSHLGRAPLPGAPPGVLFSPQARVVCSSICSSFW